MPRARVLIIEDDSAIRAGVAEALRLTGYHIDTAADGQAGLELALGLGIDLVLLDLMLPKLDGLDVLRELRRARPTLPVICLTARGEAEDRVRGLKLGADDYVVKPFGLEELLARVEAVLRRSAERPRPVERFTVAGRRIDLARREVATESGETRQLAEREADVLAYLASNPGRAISREELLERVWGLDPRGMQTRTVDMAVARLREHLGDDAARGEVIATVRGKGYMLGTIAPTPDQNPEQSP